MICLRLSWIERHLPGLSAVVSYWFLVGLFFAPNIKPTKNQKPMTREQAR